MSKMHVMTFSVSVLNIIDEFIQTCLYNTIFFIKEKKPESRKALFLFCFCQFVFGLISLIFEELDNILQILNRLIKADKYGDQIFFIKNKLIIEIVYFIVVQTF